MKAPSKRWRKMSDVYRHFGAAIPNLDWSPEAAAAAYAAETHGTPVPSPATNGFVVGKSWANVQVAEWREGIAKGLFLPDEFLGLDDGRLDWWVREVLRDLLPRDLAVCSRLRL